MNTERLIKSMENLLEKMIFSLDEDGHSSPIADIRLLAEKLGVEDHVVRSICNRLVSQRRAVYTVGVYDKNGKSLEGPSCYLTDERYLELQQRKRER
jgi:hypothetical protein